VCPYVGWSNALPDADVNVNLAIGNSKLVFKGVGYHDKNWGAIPFMTAVQSWYWGHARLGSYSIVWFDTLGRDPASGLATGIEYFSGYVAKDGVILDGSGCGNASVKVRPWGGDDVYPPVPTASVPKGFTMEFQLTQGLFTANFTTGLEIVSSSAYNRFVGPVTGGFQNGKPLKGLGLCEQFHFPLSLA
jgi:hypothetical protein